MWYLFQSEAKKTTEAAQTLAEPLNLGASQCLWGEVRFWAKLGGSVPHNCGQSESGPVAGGAIGPWWETRLNVVVRYQPGINQVYVSCVQPSVQPSVHQVYNQVSTLWKVKTSPHYQVLAVMTSCNFWDYRVIKIYIDMSSNLILSYLYVDKILCSNPHHLWTEKAQSTNSTGV